MSPEAAKAYGTRNQGVIRELVGYSKTRPGEKMLGVSPEQPLRPGQPLPEANPFDPYRYRKYDNQLGAATNYQAAMNSLNRLNYAMYPATRNVLNAGLSLGQLAAGTFVGGAGVPLEMARRYASDWLNAPAYTTPPTSQPSQLTPPTPPTTPAGVGRVTGIPEPTYTIAEPTFNTVTPSVPKSTFTEANLPDPSIQTNLDPTNLQALGMNQSQAALYLRVITSDNPSIEDAQQFKYVFNVSDTSQLGQLLNEAIVATPSTNDQLMTNIYDDIMNLGYFGTMPSQAYAPGGGGGGGGGGGNGGASNYSGGSTWSYGGLR